jgi:hypothetical protein
MMVQGIPFVLEDAHHGGVESWRVTRAERHDTERIFLVIGTEKNKLFLVGRANANLMVSCFLLRLRKERQLVESPKLSMTSSQQGMGSSNGRVTVFIKPTVGYAHAPNEVLDVRDMLLMRFCGQNN